MKFVGDTLSFSIVGDDGATHAVHLPFYHRAAVGVFPGTRLFAVPLPSTNEVVLTPIDPSKWGDLWRLEATVADRPGSAKALVETLVEKNVNVLVHEGVSESAEQGRTVHQFSRFWILPSILTCSTELLPIETQSVEPCSSPTTLSTG